MSARLSAAAHIEDYALIGNTRSAALVSRDGSIDWWCVPRFDSPACFAALLGTPAHGRWRIGPAGAVRRVARRYRPRTLVLETELHTAGGAVRIIDCMPLRDSRTDMVRIVEGVSGTVRMNLELVIRFGYGVVVPWVRREGHTLVATGGPDTLELRTPVELRGEDFTTRARFTVHAGQRIPFVLTHSASHEPRPVPLDGEAALEATEHWWRQWCEHCGYEGRDAEDVLASLTILKALTYAPTGGMVAAATTSLPEELGGVRNWDYRFCWLRDTTFTLYALLLAGYRDEAHAWREWLLRAAAGRPQDLQVLYGVAGPGVAVVPVPHAAELLRQRRRGRRHRRAGRRVGEQLEREEAAHDEISIGDVFGDPVGPALPAAFVSFDFGQRCGRGDENSGTRPADGGDDGYGMCRLEVPLDSTVRLDRRR